MFVIKRILFFYLKMVLFLFWLVAFKCQNNQKFASKTAKPDAYSFTLAPLLVKNSERSFFFVSKFRFEICETNGGEVGIAGGDLGSWRSRSGRSRSGRSRSGRFRSKCPEEWKCMWWRSYELKWGVIAFFSDLPPRLPLGRPRLERPIFFLIDFESWKFWFHFFVMIANAKIVFDWMVGGWLWFNALFTLIFFFILVCGKFC